MAGRPRDRFLSILGRPAGDQKNIDFSTSTKIAQSGGAIDPGAPRDRFWTQKHDFRGPFLAPFFDFFEKPKNHEIDDPYNVLEGFSPSETSHFPMDFSLIFMFFPGPLPEGVFGGSRSRSFLNLYINISPLGTETPFLKLVDAGWVEFSLIREGWLKKYKIACSGT